nr:PadR family transcriptional regulator [Micromonospora sp. DSM 115978]
MKHVVLGLLAAGAAHGYEVRRRYDELFAGAGVGVNVGQIYVTLGRLEREGLVTRSADQGATGRDRKVYQLTELGTKELRSWLDRPPETPLTKPDVLLKLVTAGLAATVIPGVDPRTVVTDHRQRCLQALRDLDTQAAALTRGSVADLLTQATALHLQAELRWLEACELELTRIGPAAPETRPTNGDGENS